MHLSVRLTPRAGRDAIDGVGPEGGLQARVAAAPVDGAANRSMIRLLADELGIAPSAVRVVSGETSRAKRLEVDGVDAATLTDRWPGLRVDAPRRARR